MTAKNTDGKEIAKQERHYHPQATTERDSVMKFGAQWKVANLRDTSLQPYQTKAESFEFRLPEGVRTVDITAELFYELGNPEQKYPIASETHRVSLDR